ncbi:MAG: AI-2E family transporter [Methanomethylovorans sp.]|nr:AI-2E family transporter [Methanomethylovorans sp.]
MERSIKMAMAFMILAALGIVLAHALLPYINAFLGAFILYVLFRPLYHLMIRKLHLPKSISALLTILLSFLLILVPMYFLISTIAMELQNTLQSLSSILVYIETFYRLLDDLHLQRVYTILDINTKIVDLFSSIANYGSRVLFSAVQSLGQRVIEFTIMYFLLYYLLTGEDSDFVKNLYVSVPFNRENTDRLLNEFRIVVKTTLVSSLIIAVIQGGLLTIAFLLLDIQGAILWGTVAAILSFLPVVGATLVWIPAIIIQLLQQDYFAAVGILFAGIVISSIDNLIRPFIQKQLGALHPMISLLGIIIGVNLFGLIGLVIGPLLLSYFLLVVRMFHEEYIANYN